MISFKTYSFLLCVSIGFLGCQPKVKSTDFTEVQLANLICACAIPIVTYNDELKSLAAADDIGSLTQKMTQGDQIMESAISCITDQLNTDIKSLVKDKIFQVVEDQCRLDKRMAVDLLEKVSEFELPNY